MGKWVVEKSVVVKAGKEQIWGELVRVKSWAEWKPFIKKARSFPGEELAAGSRLKMNLIMAGPVAVPLNVTITEFVEGERLAWSGGVPGVVSAVHSFQLEEKGGETVVISREEFQGALLGFLFLLVPREDLEKLHEDWAAAIKSRVEKKA